MDIDSDPSMTYNEPERAMTLEAIGDGEEAWWDELEWSSKEEKKHLDLRKLFKPEIELDKRIDFWKLISPMIDISALGFEDLETCVVQKLEISIKPNTTPIYLPPYRKSSAEREVIKQEVQKMLDAKVIDFLYLVKKVEKIANEVEKESEKKCQFYIGHSVFIEKVGREGIVTIEESKTGETTLEIVEGMQFDRGYKSPYFVTNNTTMQAVLNEPYILIYDGRITKAADILNALSKANSDQKPLLIVAEDVEDEALATLIVNKMRGIVSVVAVKAPDFGERRTLILEDLAILTGGQVISKNKGHKLEKLTPVQLAEFFGVARTVTVAKEATTVVDGKGTEEAITLRAEEIKDQIEKATSFYEKEKLQERLGKLVGGVAIISVGGNSDIEIKEKKDRVEDALFATKAALIEGVVPGGGLALITAFESIELPLTSSDEQKGWDIVRRACHAPFKAILTNCGIEDHYRILSQIKNYETEESAHTYDAKNQKVVEATEAGLLDPAKVTRTALENAASVAGTILTTESVIFEKKDDKKKDEDSAGMY